MILKIILILFCSYLFLIAWVFALNYSRMLKEKGIVFSPVVAAPLYIFLCGGALADAIFNAIAGTIIFKERPREWLFTARVRRQLGSDDVTQRLKAQKWSRLIKSIDPGHA